MIPELPGNPGVAFIDNPAIVDPHPMLAESWSRVADQQAVALHFTTGTPECYGVHATVAETAETVTVAVARRRTARGCQTCVHHDRGVRQPRGAAAGTARRPTGRERVLTLDKPQ